ncbi:GDP-mannose mannosyl hydrolase [Porphyridium purpureum]|uniref:GDP-mannose mannosyl hydrolase n=1 Tax=Porphyridium purpureum TaxID=35688 RepID=A0A5J4Z8D5_PORPP|nr:GDP-mannose mannosyl hydrolase [Porphyridium purpureum]|eukprot:POR1078..scf295_1
MFGSRVAWVDVMAAAAGARAPGRAHSRPKLRRVACTLYASMLSTGPSQPRMPRVAVSAVVLHRDHRKAPSEDGSFAEAGEYQVVLVKRGKAPSKGLWSFPGGSVELGESLAAATEREVFEETGLRVRHAGVFHATDAIYYDNDDSGSSAQPQFHYVIVQSVCAPANRQNSPPRLVAADDAQDARWVCVSKLMDSSQNHLQTIPGVGHVLRKALRMLSCLETEDL